jgi:hypothetical protein
MLHLGNTLEQKPAWLEPNETHTKSEVVAPIIDITNIKNTPTEELAQAILKNEKLGRFAIYQMLLEENKQYRNGEFPKIESKILALVAHDVAEAKDFEGNCVRTKETAEQLKEIVKISECNELLVAIDAWFSRKTKREAEIQLHSQLIELLEQLIIIQGIEEAQKDSAQLLIGQYRVLINEKNRLDFELISEIIDIYYNLVQLSLIDIDHQVIYEYWINELNSILNWTTAQALAVTVAKYHTRIHKSNGKNSSEEYTQIALIANSFDNQNINKILFPVNGQLKQLVRFIKRIREGEGEAEITLKMHYNNLKRNYIRQNGHSTGN